MLVRTLSDEEATSFDEAAEFDAFSPVVGLKRNIFFQVVHTSNIRDSKFLVRIQEVFFVVYR